MSFLAPLAFLGSLIAVPILLLYMLRLRRREVPISSTFLWQQILQDREANTPWQRLRRNLLLILQLIILALLVLALARPFITVPAVSAGQTALLLDASASMNATDTPQGSRFASAQAQALDVIASLGGDSAVTVIRVGDVPEVLTPYTTDRAALRAAIQNAQAGRGRADWIAALTLAAAGGASSEDFTLVVISDGGLGDAADLPGISIPGALRFLRVGESAENVAISALATRALPGQAPQLFAQLSNYGPRDADVIFSLRADDQALPIVSQRYTIPADGALPIVSTAALDQPFSVLQADLTLSVNADAEDYLALDNSAWAVTRDTRQRRALIFTDGNLFLEQVLQSLPGLSLFRVEPGFPVPQQPYDLYIFDGTLPADGPLPEGDLLLLNPPDSTPLFRLGPETEVNRNTNAAITTANDDPRMAFVDLADVSILAYRPLSGADWADVLARLGDNPLVVAGETDGRQVAVLPFDLRQSDLPLQIAFPVLMSNLVSWFTPGTVLTVAGALQVGDALTFNPPLDAAALRVTQPDGSTERIAIRRGSVIYTDTRTPGVYTVTVLNADDTPRLSQQFAVNAYDPQESAIAPRDITLDGEAVAVGVEAEAGQLEFWPIAALLALAVLLIEWFAYHRRMQVPTLLGTTGRGGRRGAPPPTPGLRGWVQQQAGRFRASRATSPR